MKGEVFIPRQPPETIGEVYRIKLDELHPHPENPYGIRDDPAMQELVQSVKQFGVLVPAIARPKESGGYELIAGHRRQKASRLAGLDSMPVVVMNMDDNDAIIQLVDSNIQRENILPSERAKAYKIRMEAVKQRAGRKHDLLFDTIEREHANTTGPLPLLERSGCDFYRYFTPLSGAYTFLPLRNPG